MRKKLQIGFCCGIAILITGIVLICFYEDSGTAWPLPIPNGYRIIIFIGSFTSLVSGLLLEVINKTEK